MMPSDWLAACLIVAGVFFLGIGALGFVRLPDLFCRMHVTGVIDTLGAPLVLLGAAVHLGAELVSIKLLLAVLFLIVTSPLIGHLLARAAIEGGYQPQVVADESGREAAPAGTGGGAA
jgi:multicomponent Na+:H+ antiporter subunit G